MEIKNALLEADGFNREEYVRAPREWNSKKTRHFRKLKAPAYRLNDAPVAFHRPLRKYFPNPAESLSAAGLRFENREGLLVPSPHVLMIS